MIFLQPWILAALPLIGLPVLIHLINQRRFQTMPWAAMMFLLAANRMSRGYARLRQWLILLFRMLVIAALLFAVSRPLASGWLGWSGAGRVDTMFVLLDQSPSMQQLVRGSDSSKLSAALNQLGPTFETLGASRWVLIDSTRMKPLEFVSSGEMLGSLATGPTSASADICSMLEVVREYIQRNKVGRAEVWICSDLRQHDWLRGSDRWPAIRDAFQEFPQSIRWNVLANTQLPQDNVSIRVVSVRQVQSRNERNEPGGSSEPTDQGLNNTNDNQPGEDAVPAVRAAPEHLQADLLLTIQLLREGGAGSEARFTHPIQLELEGARTEIPVEMSGPKHELKDFHVRLDQNSNRGWGRVAIPADENLSDNDYFFVFDQEPVRRAIIVADDPNQARSLQLAASIAPDADTVCEAEVVSPNGLATIDWNSISLVMWLAALPTSDDPLIRSLVDRGGQVVFFGAPSSVGGECFGVRFEEWRDASETETMAPLSVETWRGDHDLLTRTQSGNALPVGELRVHRYCRLSGEFTSLATLSGGVPLLVRVPSGRGGIYVMATTPSPSDSTLERDGVMMYVLVQRALAAGVTALRQTQQLTAGDVTVPIRPDWATLAGGDQGLSNEREFHRGIYAGDDRLVAVNRSEEEDRPETISSERLESLFKGLDFHLVDTSSSNPSSLVQEIWRTFLMSMMLAMIVESALCVPQRPSIARGTGNTVKEFS